MTRVGISLILSSAVVAAAMPAARPLAAQERAARARGETPSYDREVERLRREIRKLQRQRFDARIQRSLRAADSVLRELQPELGRSVGALAALQARVAASAAHAQRSGADDERLRRLATELALLQRRVAHDVARASVREIKPLDARWAEMAQAAPAPRGWLGISYSGTVDEQVHDGMVVAKHRAYPVIESVEPGSPAEAAGLEAGDTIVAYNGKDVCATSISMAKLLEPGARVVVRVRRDGKTRNIPVRITRRPARFGARPLLSTRVEVEPGVAVRVEPDVVVSPPDAAPRAASPRRRPGRVRAPDGGPPVPPTPPAPPVPMSFVFGGGTHAVAGAEVVRMNDDLRDAFGGRRGVLVIAVASGTPAAQAGLRGGDVIVRADKRSVQTPAALQRAVQRADDRTVALEVVRKGKERRVILRW